MLNDRSYRNPQSTHHTINYNTWVDSCTRIKKTFFLLCYTFPAVGSQTVVEEHRGDVPSRADVLSGVTPFTLTGSGSAYRFEYGQNEAATDYWQAGYFILTFTDFTRLHRHSLMHTHIRYSRNTYYWQQLVVHYRVPSFHSLFSQLNTEINYISPSVC